MYRIFHSGFILFITICISTSFSFSPDKEISTHFLYGPLFHVSTGILKLDYPKLGLGENLWL